MSTEMSLLSHLEELRKRLMVSMGAALLGSIIAFGAFPFLFTLLSQPFQAISSSALEQPLYMNTIFEGFFTKIKVSLLFGIIFSFPIHLYQVIRFIFPGLKSKEKRVLVWMMVLGMLLAVFSLYMGYVQILPVSIQFLTSSKFIPEQVGLLLNYTHSVGYILNFLLYAMLAFQLPLVLGVLLYFNVVRRRPLFRGGRYVIVAVFVLSAIVTPPDFISQIGIAVPLIGLYYLTLGVAWVFKWGNEPSEASAVVYATEDGSGE